MKDGLTLVLLAALLAGATWCAQAFLSGRRRTQTNACVGNMQYIDAAKEQWAYATHTTNGPVDIPGASIYMKGGMPRCPAGGTYTVGELGDDPRCSIHRSMHDRRTPRWWE